MTEAQLNRRFEDIANDIETLTASLDRLEEVQMTDREAQCRAEAWLDRTERLIKLIVRAGDRERKDLREKMAALVDAQICAADRHAAFEQKGGQAIVQLAQTGAQTNKYFAAAEANGQPGREGDGV